MPRIGLDLTMLVNTAAIMADEEGFEAVTLASLAKKLNVRSPSLYNHVAGLEELRTELALYGYKKLTDSIRSAVLHANDDPVMHMCIAYLNFVRKHPGQYEATLRAPDRKKSELMQASQKLTELITSAIQVYGLDRAMAAHAVIGLRSLLHGCASLEKSGGFSLTTDVDESLRLNLQLFLTGIRTWNKVQADEI